MILRSAGSNVFLVARLRCTTVAARTASVALSKVASMASPMNLTIVPPPPSMPGTRTALCSSNSCSANSSSVPIRAE